MSLVFSVKMHLFATLSAAGSAAGDLAPARDVREGSAAAALAPACRAGEEGWPRPRLPLFIWSTAFPGALFPNHVPGGGSQLG